MRRRVSSSVVLLFLVGLVAVVAGCGSDASTDTNTNTNTDTGIRVIPVDQAAEVFGDQPEGMVVLDVRTPEEFEAGHLEGATLVDFYESDFAEQLADLDRDTPYLLYCRSGNRSRTTRDIMADLGFSNVTDIEGGINAWVQAGEPVVG